MDSRSGGSVDALGRAIGADPSGMYKLTNLFYGLPGMNSEW